MNQPDLGLNIAEMRQQKGLTQEKLAEYWVQGLDRGSDTLGNVFTLLPPLPILFLAIFTSYQAIVNTVRALSEKPIHHPLSIPFVK